MMDNPVVCHIVQMNSMDATGVWFYNQQEGTVAVVAGDGHLLWETYEPMTEVPPTLLLNGRWEAPALLEALENTPTANTWKARYEELAAQLELAESRVEKIINKALN